MQKTSRLIRMLIIIMICLSCVIVVSCPVSAEDNPSSINDLVENMAKYDKKTITLSGEVLGESLERDNGCWVNMSDGGNAIGVWMSKSDAAQIRVFGDYKHTGDMVTVTGTFYQACPTHGGEPDIHCTRLVVTTEGIGRSEDTSTVKVLAAAAAVALVLTLLLTYHKKVVKKDVQST